MQLNLGIFEFNRRTGYVRKPAFMCREDRMFDPFADTPVDGIVPGTVAIQVNGNQEKLVGEVSIFSFFFRSSPGNS